MPDWVRHLWSMGHLGLSRIDREFRRWRGSGLDSDPGVWKSIEIGGVPATDLIRRIESRYALEVWAGNLMHQPAFTTLQAKKLIKLALLTPAQIGSTRPPWQCDLYHGGQLERWSRTNLDGYVLSLCLPEVGPHLRLGYDEQPRSDRGMCWIAMDPILDGYGEWRYFYLSRYGWSPRTCELAAGRTTLTTGRWSLDTPLVFQLMPTIERTL